MIKKPGGSSEESEVDFAQAQFVFILPSRCQELGITFRLQM
jgi:hypothetical protein